MSNGYAINGINYYDPTALMNDSAFLQAFQSMNVNSPAFKAAQQMYQPQVADTTLLTTPTENTAQPPAVNVQPTKEGNGLLVGGVLTTAAAVGAIAYAAKRGNGEGIKQGFKNIWKGLKGKFGNSNSEIKEVLQKLNLSKAQEYTVAKDGVSIVMKDGKPVKITTSAKKEITDAIKIEKWKQNNQTVIDEIEKQTLSGKLPKGYTLRYEHISPDGKYKIIVENGKVVEAFGKDKDDKFIKVADDQLEAFIKNHADIVKDAETLKKTLNKQKVRIIGKNGKETTTTSNIEISVRNGKVIEARLGKNGRLFTEQELRMLQNDLGQEISIVGKESGNTYGLRNYEYIYRQQGGQKVRFTKNGNDVNVTGVHSVTKKEITDAEEIKKFLENNKGIDDGIKTIQNGTLAEGFRLGNITLKAESGNLYTVKNGHVTEVKLSDGTTKNGQELKEWLKVAENKNECDKVLKSIES